MRIHRLRQVRYVVLIAAFLYSMPLTSLAQRHAENDSKNGAIDVKAFEHLEWRSIGPANMGGRTADVEGVAGNPNLVYVGTASGGIWKTTNGGMSWTPIFERQGTISIGDLAVDPNNSDVIWAGTGETNVRNSVSFGDGVYRSNDGGKSWQHMGLKETERISAIIVSPRDPNTVYVGALGHAFGPNPERGVFMTTDGGKSWQKTLYIDPEHGVSDLAMDPENPNILYAGMWHFLRKPWTFESGGEKGGLYKSIDGGRTWKKITEGLPKLLGRIGVRAAPSNPNVVYAIVESKEGSLYRSDDKGETFKQVSKDQRIVQRGFYYTRVRVDPTDENRVYGVASTLYLSIDGGHTFKPMSTRTHVDYHAFWIDPKDPNYMWQGQDGGVAVSHNKGETWQYVNNMPLGQFYQIYADNRQPFYYVMGGLQDNGSWTGPSRTREPAGILNDDWRMVSFGDGFYMYNHPDNPDLYISEAQGGSIVLTDMQNREQQSITPAAEDGGGPASNAKYRFNWNAPIHISSHDKNTVYLGGNVLFKSTDFGRTWQKISGDLTTNDPEKQKNAGGPVSIENTAAEYNNTIISIAESPVKKGMIWAGTDDGNLQLTTDAGQTWNNLVRNVKGLGTAPLISHVEPSRTSADTAYVSFDRHMLDDFKPYIYKTTDSGKNWTDISGNLPEGAYVWVVREDPKNTNLIYAGTELGLFASYTGGKEWVSLNLKNLPTVAVHDIYIHPRENDLILATHGRSVWILDDATPIQQASADVLNSDLYMFDIRPALRYTTRFTRYGIADAVFTGPNPAYGALITYYLKEKPDDKTKVKIQILDQKGKVIREIEKVSKEKGMNRASWNLSYEGAHQRRPPSGEEQDSFFGGPRGARALPGTYTVKLMVGDKSVEKRVEVRLDPTVQVETTALESTFDYAMKLRDMQSAGNDALHALDSISEQLGQREKTVKDQMPDAPEDLKKAFADYKKQVNDMIDRLARAGESDDDDLGSGPRLVDKIGSLFFTIDSTNAAPTPAQKEYFTSLQTELQKTLADVNNFLSKTVAGWNEKLRQNNVPTLLAGKPIEVPR